MMPVNIQLLSFDLDDTLWDNWPVIRQAESALHQWLTQHAPKVVAFYDPPKLMALRRAIISDEPHLKHDLSKLRTRAIERACIEVGYPTAQAQQLANDGFAYFLEQRHKITLFDDTLEALTQLQRHYPLAALTNGNADLTILGLDHLFSYYLSPAEVGSAKPNPEMFHALSQQAEIPLGAILHIGDCPNNDLLGALNVGMQAIWLNRRGLEAPETQHRIIELQTLTQVVAHLLPQQA